MNTFITALRESFSVREYENGWILSTPMMYSGADHTLSFYIVPNEGGSFTVSDRGETLEYLRECVDPRRFEGRIASICERFEIVLENGVFYRTLASYASNQTMRNLYTFLGAMYMIANVDAI